MDWQASHNEGVLDERLKSIAFLGGDCTDSDRRTDRFARASGVFDGRRDSYRRAWTGQHRHFQTPANSIVVLASYSLVSGCRGLALLSPPAVQITLCARAGEGQAHRAAHLPAD